jgi:hypothetical protein
VHLVKGSVVVKSTLGIRRKDDLTCTQITRREKNLKFECGNMLPKPAARYQIA